MMVTKKIILNIILIIWVIFSIGYIIWDIWADFKTRQLNQAYQQGRTDTINYIIEQAQGCDSIPFFSGEKQVLMINIDCLKEGK